MIRDISWMDRRWSSPLADPAYRAKVWDRLVENIAVVNGCWEWQRFRTPDGYGCISVKRRMTGAHQVALALHRGRCGARIFKWTTSAGTERAATRSASSW